ncbi:MAG: hypothetical protein C4523_10225 [Myxococcales bacterium]|nr:MAG: hypothetical protein C4523_10225 [Myxococcales bacterium]
MRFGEEALDFKVFTEAVSEFCKVNVQLPEQIKASGQLYILTPDGLDCPAAWDLYLQVVPILGMTFTSVGPYKKFAQTKDMMTLPSVVYIQSVPAPDRGQPQSTLVYRLQHLDADTIRKVLDPLRSEAGRITSFEDTLIIVEQPDMMPKLVKLLEQLDIGGAGTKVYYWPAMHSPIADVAKIAEQLFLQAKQGESRAVGLEKLVVDERTNGMFIIGSEEACTRVLALVPKLDVDIVRTSQMEVVFLRFATAETLAQTLQSIVREGSGKASGRKQFGESLEVKVSADKQTNSLVLIGPPRGLEEIKKLIDKLDRFPRQVFIEVVMLEVSVGDTKALGLAVTGGRKVGALNDAYVVGGANYGSLNALAIDPSSLLGLAIGTRVGEVEGSQEAFGLGFAFPKFGALVRMMQTSSNVNVMANPCLLGVDAEEAEIVVGSNVPFVTGTALDSFNQPVLSIQRQDVALTIKIKPEINENNRVKMKLEVTIEDLASISELLGPTTTKRAIKTTAIAESGSRVALGGLLRDRELSGAEKVPLLGDLPILGRLFRSESESKEKVNLMVVFTPTVLETPDDLKAIFKRKLEERSEYIREMYGDENLDYKFNEDLARRVGVVEEIKQIVDEQKRKASHVEQERVIVITPEGAAEDRAAAEGKEEGERIDRSAPPPLPAVEAPPGP